jgi:ABC-type enterochelin transport system permease subunit
VWQAGVVIRKNANNGGTMEVFGQVKSVARELIDIGLVLIALAIVLSILVGGTLPFFGSVVGNLTSLVKDLGSNGLVGLIVLGVILWLFNGRTAAPARK